MLVGWLPVHQAPCLSTERKVSGSALSGELATSRPERENHRGGTMKLQHIVGTLAGKVWTEQRWQSKTTFYLRLWGTNDDHVDPDTTWPRAIHRPPHQQHRRDFSFQPPYSGAYEAVPPDSPSSPCTTRTSADRRRYLSLVHVKHPIPRGFHPRPHDLFSSYKPLRMFPCASRTWLRIRRGQSITNTPCWRGCDQARTASG